VIARRASLRSGRSAIFKHRLLFRESRRPGKGTFLSQILLSECDSIHENDFTRVGIAMTSALSLDYVKKSI